MTATDTATELNSSAAEPLYQTEYGNLIGNE